MSFENPTELELALIALQQNARDGNGRPVKLVSWVGIPTVEQVRDSLFDFLESVDVDSRFICLDARGQLVESREAEAAFWDNLSLLARATSARLRERP